MKSKVENRNGYVLPLILVLFLCLGISVTALFYLPGTLGRIVKRTSVEMQGVYDGESSIVAHLAGFPNGYFGNLPKVDEFQLGPYREICVPVMSSYSVGKKLCVYGVEPFRDISVSDWMAAAERYRQGLNERILSQTQLKMISGNRRFFEIPAVHSLRVLDGDLLLDASSHVQSANYVVDGNVTVKGTASFDTLRVYSRGNVSLRGRLAVCHLEVAGTEIEVGGETQVKGILLASRAVTLTDHATAGFPSFGVALGLDSPEVNVKAGAVLEGAAVAPGGMVQLGSERNIRGVCVPCDDRRRSRTTDSTRAVLPAFFGGKMIVFGGGVLP